MVSRMADDPVVMTREGYDNLKKELSSPRYSGYLAIDSKNTVKPTVDWSRKR